ncbi:MAG: phage portal protein [Anaerolineales bacterium]|nr:phage portal protein [Anaerolineales bacterium]
MNHLDKVISWLSPQAGLRRARARALTEVVLAYEGARSARRQGGWNTTNTSGNAEIGVGAAKLRANARDLCRNNAYGRKAKREWAKRVVGAGGITPRPDTGSDAIDRTILDLWEQFAAHCCSDHRINFAAAEKIIVSSAYESGEVLVRLWDRKIGDGLAVPLQLQIMEADYLDIDKTQTTATGTIVHGVEFDPLGRIKGYWLYGSHPGGGATSAWRSLFKSKFVPVEYVLHHADVDRPGDARAVTRFAAVIGKLHDLDEYADAEIMRKKVEACLAAMVTQPEGAEGPTLGSAAVDATTGLKVEELRPGMIMYGAPGADVKFLAPSTVGGYAEYKKTELREVAAGLEIPYVVLDDNLEAVNYSSYRGGLLAFRDAIDEYRENWLIPQVLNPIWRRFIDKIWTMGMIRAVNYRVRWDPPPFDLLDRAAEAEADRAELQIGKKSWPQLIGEQGNDSETQLGEIEKWKPRLDAAGVSFAKTTSESAAKSSGADEGDNNAVAQTK